MLKSPTLGSEGGPAGTADPVNRIRASAIRERTYETVY